MSYCEIITFKDGKPGESLECRNAWGGSAFIWDALFNKFLKRPNVEHDTWLLRADDLWQLHKRQDVPVFMRAIQVSTYDHAIVRRENLPQFVKDLREFLAFFGSNGRVCHLETWAKFIEGHLDVEAIGFYGTSVTENLWGEWDEEKDSRVPYDLNQRTEHYDVYEHLAELGLNDRRSLVPQ